MIDRIIYTYVPEAGKSRSMGFRSEEVFLQFFNESIEASLKSVSEVVVFCSKENEEYLKDNIKHNVIIQPVQYSEFEFDKRFWNVYKIISLYLSAVEGVPALHMDLDYKLTKELAEELLSKDVVCERRRAFYVPRRGMTNRFPKDVVYDPYIICSGAFGSTDVSLIKDYFKVVMEAVKIDLGNDEPVTNKERILIEEGLFTALCNQNQKSIAEMKKEDFIHLQGDKKLMI